MWWIIGILAVGFAAFRLISASKLIDSMYMSDRE